MNPSSPYSRIDRVVHSLAFRSLILQDILADLENNLYSKVWVNTRIEKPIFITSLPRAGTTIILEALNQLPETSTHTYRDMPFILTPILWNKLSCKFYNKGTQRERAHGDGLIISEDSPEAFEEIIWKKFFPKHYAKDNIILWKDNEPTSRNFIVFFQEHIKKIVTLRQFSRSQDKQNITGRYISKNNANIARTQTILTLFPDACIIVPLRNPLEHAISLWRQHLNFAEQHRKDDFSKKYMEDIGHFEFGSLHRPIHFPKTQELTNGLTPDSLDYWVAYWISAFEFLSDQPNIHFLCYESLCQSGPEGLSVLCKHLEISASRKLINEAASIFNKPPQSRSFSYEIAAALSTAAAEIYSLLRKTNLLDNILGKDS